MFSINDLFDIVRDFAPIELSYACIKNGDYDNSGIMINAHNQVDKVLFSLDLSNESVKRAKRLGCDTIITHHPAIYYPIKTLDSNGASSAVIKAAANNINVLSMHLNLDVCKQGIDESLAEALGAKHAVVLDAMSETEGYGREFDLNGEAIKDIKNRIEKNLKTKKIITYAKLGEKIFTAASFCGAGGGYVEKMLFDGRLKADLIITSDAPHHVIKEIIECGKKAIIIPHYASENYGFYKFYQSVKEKIEKTAKTYYFEDKRFL